MLIGKLSSIFSLFFLRISDIFFETSLIFSFFSLIELFEFSISFFNIVTVNIGLFPARSTPFLSRISPRGAGMVISLYILSSATLL